MQSLIRIRDLTLGLCNLHEEKLTKFRSSKNFEETSPTEQAIGMRQPYFDGSFQHVEMRALCSYPHDRSHRVGIRDLPYNDFTKDMSTILALLITKNDLLGSGLTELIC